MLFQEPAGDPDHDWHHCLSDQVPPFDRQSEGNVDMGADAACQDHLLAELKHFS
jgi:hypothetical protein